MPVSGLVVTLTPATSQEQAVAHAHRASPADTSPGLSTCSGSAAPVYPQIIKQIQQHPNFQTGERQDQRLPVVLDTPDKETDKRCWGWLNELPGVHHVDVAFIHFEDEDALDASPCSVNAKRPIAAPTIGET